MNKQPTGVRERLAQIRHTFNGGYTPTYPEDFRWLLEQLEAALAGPSAPAPDRFNDGVEAAAQFVAGLPFRDAAHRAADIRTLKEKATQPAPEPLRSPDTTIWECKIGLLGNVPLPKGADFPMRRAIGKAFKEVTGVDATFNFSGWSAQLAESELAVIENRMPRKQPTPAPATAHGGTDDK